jgi:hypothetical protein
MRCTPMSCTPVRYAPMRHTPMRYTLLRCGFGAISISPTLQTVVRRPISRSGLQIYTAVYCLEQVLCEWDCYRSRTCPRRAHPLGLPLSARLDSVLSNILSPARCSWCAEFCMRGCKYLEWERERKVFAGEMGEKMGEEWSQIRDPWLWGGTPFGPLVKS